MQKLISGNMPKKVTLAISLSLVLASVMAPNMVQTAGARPAAETGAPQSIASEQDLVQWMTYYYLHPQPQLLVPAVLFAEQKGFLAGEGQAPLTAFVSRVMAQNPGSIGGWFETLEPALKAREKEFLWTAAYWSATKEGTAQLTKVEQSLSPSAQAALHSQIAQPPKPLEQMEISSPAVLDELWGAFSATGDERYVNRIMSTLDWLKDGDLNKMSIAGAARWSLASNAQQHPKVLQICQKARENQPALRAVLDQIIADASGGQQGRNKQTTR